MKRYPLYKSSRVKWLGEIPIDWECKTLKRITKFAYGDSLSDENRKGGDVPVYGSNGVVGFHDTPITNAPCIIVGRKGSYGRINFSEIPCFPIDTSYFVDSTKTNCNLYWLKHFLSILRLDENTLDDMVPGLSREWAYRMPGLIIPLPEQNSIVRFLDHKTGQIDRFIANRQKQIELLKEQKAGIINKAVTKGIDPDVKMKPSAIEWIGLIPEHWSVTKVKFVSKVKGRIGFRGYTVSDLVEEGEGALTLGATHISKEGEIELSKPVFISWRKYYESPEIMVEKGDILVVQRGSVGVVGIVNSEIGCATINPSLTILKKVKMNRQLLFLQLKSKIVKEAITTIFNETAVPMLSQNQISNFNILLPPNLAEQLSITEFITLETSTIDTLISKYQKQIDLMKEYRTSLISQAVTGKIDVRDWQPKNRKLSMEQLPMAMTSEN